MDYLRVRTRGNSDPNGKPRVYFTCHPEDFDQYFDKVCNDLFESQDCAVYYTPDMAGEIPFETGELDLGRMNLFVIPVTHNLLREPNRAMEFDYRFAERNHIPILPLMMEDELDSYYAAKFGERQYIKPFSSDLTEVNYSQKLKNYLDSTIGMINEELVKMIREAFDAYIFLSYRKKDRKLANDLIKKIHSFPGFQGLAVWYDEFIKPGEGFRDYIQQSMDSSRLVLMLVTPNLINEANFVQQEEYPMAMKLGKDVVPAVARITDRRELERQYPGIPGCVNVEDIEQLRRRLSAALSNGAGAGSPEHDFYMGLAYLFGIDVEVNKELALRFLVSAADAEYELAIEILRTLYTNGDGVAIDYRQALLWAKKLVEYRRKTYGNEHTETMKALSILGRCYIDCGEYQNAIQSNVALYEAQSKVLGPEHPDTLITLHNLAVAKEDLGDKENARELYRAAYLARYRVLGENAYETQTSLFGYAGALDDYDTAIELYQAIYANISKLYGENDHRAVAALINIGTTYGKLGKNQESYTYLQKAYASLCGTVGDTHPRTLDALSNLVVVCMALERYKYALNLAHELYSSLDKVLGKEHPKTLRALYLLSMAFKYDGNYQRAISLADMAYTAQARVLGSESRDATESLINMVDAYAKISEQKGDRKAAIDYRQKKLVLENRIYGQENPATLGTLADIALDYVALKDYEQAREYQKIVYDLRCKTLGEKHPSTLDILFNYAISCAMLGYVSKAITIAKAVYEYECEIYGANHSKPQQTLSTIHHMSRML